MNGYDLLNRPIGEFESWMRGLIAEEIQKVSRPVRDETILSDEDAARLLGKSVSTLSRWKKQNKIKTVMTSTGRKVRVCDLPSVGGGVSTFGSGL